MRVKNKNIAIWIAVLIIWISLFFRIAHPLLSDLNTPGYLRPVPINEKKIGNAFSSYPSYRPARDNPLNTVVDNLLKKDLFGKRLVRYYLRFQLRINPEGREFTVLSGAAGADISTLVLVTNFTTAYVVDTQPVSFSKLRQLKAQWNIPLTQDHILYIRLKRGAGYGNAGPLMKVGLEEFILIELQAMGVKQEDIEINEDNNSIIFKLPGETKQREVIFVNSEMIDLTKNDGFNKRIKGDLDAYFQKAANVLPDHYSEYLGIVADWIKPSGFMVMDNYIPLSSSGKPVSDTDLFRDPLPVIGDEFNKISVDDIEELLNNDPDVSFLFEVTDNPLISKYNPAKAASYYGWRLSLYRKIGANLLPRPLETEVETIASNI